ncbi:hypothetical protein Tco_0597313 [Tanacetum coccineum]
MTNSHQQSITDACSKNNPPILEKGKLSTVGKSFYKLMHDMDRHEILPKKIAINTKFLNLHQPKWSKYVTMVRLMHKLHEVDYDLLYDFLKQNEVNVNVSRVKQAAKAHDPLALVANTFASSSNSRSPPVYYVTHLPLVNDIDYDTKSYA